MNKRERVQSYMTAILQNPKFFDWAARRYGKLLTSGEGLIPDVAVEPLAKAVVALEEQLTQQIAEDSKVN